jgi:hypothetical protein
MLALLRQVFFYHLFFDIYELSNPAFPVDLALLFVNFFWINLCSLSNPDT